MSAAELSELEEIETLIANGRRLGVLTYAELTRAVSEFDLDEADVEQLHRLLEKQGIELVEETPLDLEPEITVDSLQLFLNNIGKVPLLKAPQEIELAKRIERGDLDAKQKMVESNLRLVVANAKNYRNHGLPFLDLIQEGTIGLVRATEKYDKSRTIRIPVHVNAKLLKSRRAERGLVTKLGREPSVAEIAEAAGLAPEEIDSIKRTAQPTVSLEMAVGDDKESELGQFIADERAESPHERAAETLTQQAVHKALKNLSYRERRILELRYGLGDEQPRTLADLSSLFDLTRERVRQIENGSLRKLRALVETDRPDGVGGSGDFGGAF